MMKIILVFMLTLSGLYSATEVDSFKLKKCQTCHGEKFEKKALSISKIVKDFSLEEIKTALLGYKNHTYGNGMKNLMTAQLMMYQEKELITLAKAIFSLNNETKPKELLPILPAANCNTNYCGKKCTCGDSNTTIKKNNMSFRPNNKTNMKAYNKTLNKIK